MRSYAFSGKAGTPWMHARILQEQALLAVPLIVANPHDDGRDEVARVAAPGEQNGPVLDLELVLIPPMRSATIALDADNAGQWAFDCHHLYHMATGMMSTIGDRTEARA